MASALTVQKKVSLMSRRAKHGGNGRGYSNACGKRHGVALKRKVNGKVYTHNIPCSSWVYVTRHGTYCARCDNQIPYCRCKGRGPVKDWAREFPIDFRY